VGKGGRGSGPQAPRARAPPCNPQPPPPFIPPLSLAVTDIQTNNVPEWVLFQRAAYGYSTLEANATHMSISLFGDDVNDKWYTANFTK
jgi:hypothetical protein